MIGHIGVISWDMQLLQDYYLLETRSTFVIHISHHVLFGEYNYHLSIEDKHTPGSLLFWKYPESFIDDSDLLNFILC